MGFAGNLRTLGLTEVLQTLHRTGATGVLSLAHQELRRTVVFDAGEIIGLTLPEGSSGLMLRRLILRGTVDPEVVASISAGGGDSQLLHALVEQQRLKAEDIDDAYQAHGEDELASLCTWIDADFIFTEANDADAEGIEATDQVLRARSRPLRVGVPSMLLEAARRSDEWTRLTVALPDTGAILAPTDATNPAWLTTDYPLCAVAPLLDGIRTIAEVQCDSAATRLEVYGTLFTLLEQGLVRALNEEDLVAAADEAVARQDWSPAARLYRHALQRMDDDRDVRIRLADCLGRLGDVPEAAASHAQLALEWLDDGQPDQALACARRGVALKPSDHDVRLTLVRVLVATGEQAEALVELHTLAASLRDAGRLEEARSTCLKILELAPQDETARGMLARLLSGAEKDATSEDVVVCISCRTVNHREATTCTTCKVSLRLTCASCGKTVAVSDRLCIFCGAHPGDGSPATARLTRGAAATSRIIRKDDATTAGPVGTLTALAAKARACEAAGDGVGALSTWRELAKHRPDDAEVRAKVRELEAATHGDFVERRIGQAQAFRKGRRFIAAVTAYREVLRAIGPTDQRRVPLEGQLAATRRDLRRTTVLYGAACVVLLVLGAMAAWPYYEVNRIRRSAERLNVAVGTLPQQGAAAVQAATAELAALDDDALRLRDVHRRQAQEALAGPRGALEVARLETARRDLLLVERALAAEDLPKITAALAEWQSTWHEPALEPRAIQVRVRLNELRRLAAARSDLTALAPALLAEAEGQERAGNLGTALTAARMAASSEDAAIRAKAEAIVVRLEQASTELTAALTAARALVTTDLVAAGHALAAVQVHARAFQQDQVVADELQQVAAARQQATTAWAIVKEAATPAPLQGFLAAHAASPEAVAARNRLELVTREAAAREALLTRFRNAQAAGDIAIAWRAGMDLHRVQAGPADLTVPVRVEGSPIGALVSLGDEELGHVPVTIALRPDEVRSLRVAAPGFATLSVSATVALADWRWQPRLAREARWTQRLSRPARALVMGHGQVLALPPGQLVAIRSGTTAWQAPLGDDLDAIDARGPQPAILADGRIAVPQPAGGLLLLDRGAEAGRLATAQPIRGRPLSIRLEVLGDAPRLVVAAEALLVQDPGGVTTRIPLPAAVIAGPVAMTVGSDVLLVMADVRGRLLAVDPVARRIAWELPLKASDCGLPVPVGPDLVAVVLDGGRLALIEIGGDAATVRWERRLSGPAVGEPIAVPGGIRLAQGAQVIGFTLDGAALPAVTLSATATATAAVEHGAAIGCQDGAVMFLREGVVAWTSPGPAPVTAVALEAGQLVVADGLGGVTGYAW